MTGLAGQDKNTKLAVDGRSSVLRLYTTFGRGLRMMRVRRGGINGGVEGIGENILHGEKRRRIFYRRTLSSKRMTANSKTLDTQKNLCRVHCTTSPSLEFRESGMFNRSTIFLIVALFRERTRR